MFDVTGNLVLDVITQALVLVALGFFPVAKRGHARANVVALPFVVVVVIIVIFFCF